MGTAPSKLTPKAKALLEKAKSLKAQKPQEKKVVAKKAVTKAKKVKKAEKKKAPREQYVLPPLNKAELDLCKNDKWLEAAKAYHARNTSIMPHRCMNRIAEYYRTRLQAVLEKQKEYASRYAKPRG